MTIVWDKTGERLYETGTDRGVLYLYDRNEDAYNGGVAWNGLTGVTSSPSGAEPTPLYADNIKYVNMMSAEEYGGTIEAYTYPDEFSECDGSYSTNGVNVGQQDRKTFGFSWRTKVGNDTDGDSHGYKIHLVWGALAQPSEKAYATVNDSPEAITFSWTFTTTPEGFDPDGDFADLKPTAYVEIDSTKIAADALREIEDILYGRGDTDGGVLPSPDEILALAQATAPEPASYAGNVSEPTEAPGEANEE